MTEEIDLFLSRVAVRLRNPVTDQIIGTGLLYYEQSLKDNVYIITAAHNFYNDSESFNRPISQIKIDLYDYQKRKYRSVVHKINFNLVSANIDEDLAILVLIKSEIENLVGQIPNKFSTLKEQVGGINFIVRGFPNATKGVELASITPTWIQRMPSVRKFQLLLHEDYSSWATGGFSGSGVFLKENNQLYLLGIFTRFRAEEKGKVIYCQYIDGVNKILAKNFLPEVSFSFFGSNGLTLDFFKLQINSAIQNLGPRYNEFLNFKLPIAKLFNDISRDDIFKKRLIRALDFWLINNGHRFDPKDQLLKDIETEISELKEKTISWIPSIDWSADQRIDIGFISDALDSLRIKVDKRRSELYELQRADTSKKEDNIRNSYSYRAPYEEQINRLYEIQRLDSDFGEELDRINVTLSNSPYLLIQGEAGCGKSHLLGDIAMERNRRSAPTLLLLGQLFRPGQSAWQNILGQLGLSCSKEQLLTTLNSIGKQIGSRVLFLIDALNEGAGKEIWHSELAGFLEDFRGFPFIGVVLTIRSTYFSTVIPEVVKASSEITKISHEGFKGNEYAALKLFCEHHELALPNFPILSPDFSNPLFLQLICIGVKNSGSKKFPQGFSGISAVFQLYLDAIYFKLTQKRDEYRLRKHIVVEAIYEIARAIFKQERLRAIKLIEAVTLFDQKYPLYKYLLDDLILENIFIQSTHKDYDTRQEEEIILFSYERLGDFYIANELLEPYKTKDSVKLAFTKNQVLGNLISNYYWRSRGVLEVMSILLPEKFGLEIFEVFEWVFLEKDDFSSNIDDWLNGWLLDSLKWREPGSIEKNKLTKWFRSEHFKVDDQTFLTTLIELTTQVGNPFNSDRLYQILSKYSLGERDAFWLQYLRFYTTYDDDKVAFPMRRLIDWAWQPNLSFNIDEETARLGGQTLAWVLASTKISLRDEVTKSLVNLLQEHPNALLSILKSFSDCNDMYIIERLYGVAYGCTLRTSKPSSVLKIAQYVFDNIFNNSLSNPHVLLRDYARNIVEYAIYLKLNVKGNLKKIRPPYHSLMPRTFPSEKHIKAYEIPHEHPEYKSSFAHYNNQIAFSVISWDFGRYVIDPAFRKFAPLSFTFEKTYKDFHKKLTPLQRKWVKLYADYIKMAHHYDTQQNLSSKKKSKEIKKAINNILNSLKEILPKEKYKFVKLDVTNHFKAEIDSQNTQRNDFNTQHIKRWIVKRVFDLGYNSKIHGHYESAINYYNERSGNKIERIGKKYQWIAFHEIIGIVADNYYTKSDGWSRETKLEFYQGAWQSYLRNVDPAFIAKNKADSDDLDVDENEIFDLSKWWHVPKYNFWNRPDSKWVSSKSDLPNMTQIISSKDESGNEWLCLSAHIHWRSPKPIGEDRYDGRRKEIWYMIQAYLVHKKDKTKITKHLKTRTFWNRWMPETHKANSSLFNRENYWSPAANDFGNETWDEIEGSNFKVMVTTSEAVGEMSRDHSGAHFRFDMPCQMLFDGMKLRYSPNDGEFLSPDGETVVLNPDKRGILIRKDHLLRYLKSKNLEIIWTLLGEKYSYTPRSYTDNFFKVLNGVYAFEYSKLVGSVKMTNRT
jgi:hypothetical protein